MDNAGASMSQRIAVIGAGPAGMTCAYKLVKVNAGLQVDVYDAAPQVGGLAKSIDLWGQKVDLGPHRFFSNDTRVNKLWPEVAGTDYRKMQRRNVQRDRNRRWDTEDER